MAIVQTDGSTLSNQTRRSPAGSAATGMTDIDHVGSSLFREAVIQRWGEFGHLARYGRLGQSHYLFPAVAERCRQSL
ncbi:hypothetical protein [Paraburkholderia dipogonis]|uniref:hypothetical protein n=1 Tax=Paraburkholderia dipogonis TaxID=1211383 RepID=UPI0038BD1B07